MKISVVMCTYNGGRFLQEQLASIAAQTRVPDELIVRDDCSNDDTWRILTEFAKEAPLPSDLKRNDVNRGVTGNFESALESATGDIIFLSDQDDVWRADKIESVAKIFENDPQIGMVLTDAEIVDETLSPLGRTLWDGVTKAEMSSFQDDPFSFLLTRRNIVTGAAAAFARSSVQTSLPFPSRMAVIHDGWLGLIASGTTRVVIDPRPMLKYRQHAAQVIGVREHRNDLGQSHYLLHAEQLSVLRDRLVGAGGDKLALVDSFIKHLVVRTTLPPSAVERSVSVIGELSSGRYGRFSSGLRSAAKDLLRGGSNEKSD